MTDWGPVKLCTLPFIHFHNQSILQLVISRVSRAVWILEILNKLDYSLGSLSWHQFLWLFDSVYYLVQCSTHLNWSITLQTLFFLQQLRPSSQCRRRIDSFCRFSSRRSSSSRAMLRRFANRDWFNIWCKQRKKYSYHFVKARGQLVQRSQWVTVASVWISLWMSEGCRKLICSSTW